MQREYKFGDWVDCDAIPGRDAFRGRITFKDYSVRSGAFYHVVDDAGMYWHRVPSDMKPVED